jgi:phosphatidylglycerol:prolipoprotein diacylglycerol transferase
MHPILIRIGSFTVYSYGFFIAAAFLLALGLSMHQAKRLQLNHRLVPDLGFYLILAALIGSRLFYVLLRPELFLENPLLIVQFWKGGLVFSGGALIAVLTGWWFLHRKNEPFWLWTDAFAPGIAAGQAIGRIGCLMAGCCYGKPTDLPWAITFTSPHALAPLGKALHPTQIYHSLAGVVTLIILLLVRPRLKKPGQLFALLLILYSIFRFCIEFFRGDFRGYLGPFSVTQWVTLAIFGVGSMLYIWRRRT